MLNKILKNSEYNRIFKDYSALVLLQGFNYLLPLITLPYLVRVLGVERFGLVMFAQSFCTFFIVFVDFGFNLSATRQISIIKEDRNALNSVYSAVYYIKAVLLIISLLLFAIIIFSFERFRVEKLVYFLSFGVVVGQMLFPEWFFQGMQKMRIITIVNIIAKSVFTFLVFIYIKTESDYIKVPIFSSLGFILAGIISFIISLKHASFIKVEKKMGKELFVESSSLFVSNFASRLFNSANVFILGLIGGNALAGIYASIEKLILALKSFIFPLYQAVYPWLSKQSRIVQEKSILKIVPYVLIFASTITVLVFIFARFFLHLIYNDPEIENFAYIFRIASLIVIFSSLNMLIVTLFLPAIRDYNKRMTILITVGVFNLLVSLTLTFLYSITGTVIAVVLSECLLMIMGWAYFFKQKKQLADEA